MKPDWVLTKNRTDDSTDWANYHVGLASAEYYAVLNSNAAQQAGSSVWGDTAPTSTVFTVGGANTKNNASGKSYISYCFAPIQGYSKFGQYKGNANANGPFIYTGFRPAFFILKRYNSTGNWLIYDNKRDTLNEVLTYLVANATDASSTASDGIDFLSNGVKIRRTGVSWNGDGDDYLYIAFAENPFVTSKGTPTTAR